MKKKGLAVLVVGLVASCIVIGSILDDTATYSGSSTFTPLDDSDSNAHTTKPKPKPTVAQQQALDSAQSYVEMSGFSRAGLLHQLTANAGEGFKKKDAEYAIKHVKVNWNHEAVESARSYLDMGGFSRSSLINQLHSKAGEGFTLKQATYAANKVGM